MKPSDEDENLPVVLDEIKEASRRKLHGVVRVKFHLGRIVSCIEEKSLSLPSFKSLKDGGQNVASQRS